MMHEHARAAMGRPHGTRDVEFSGGSGVAVAGVLGGVSLALGGMWVLLSHSQSLDPKVMTTLVIVALALGGLVALTAAFFGLVIPRHVHKGCGCGESHEDEGQ